MRVAFTLIGGRNWTGGYNYLLNLVKVLAEHQGGRVTPVLLFGTDTDEAEAAPFAAIAGAEIVRTPLMNQARKTQSLLRSLVLGVDAPVRALFQAQRIDLVFESAVFFGWRLGLPTVAWIPDLQHRVLPQLFGRLGYWKRELGFLAQVLSGRSVMVSSEDTRAACERHYAGCRGRTHVVHFAVPPVHPVSSAGARAVADQYGLPAHFFFMPNQFWRHKNHLLVLQALALLRERGQPVLVAASGKQADPRDPEHFPKVAAMIEGLGLQDDFRLLGLIPYAHLGALMQASTALLNPSTFEGWSTTVEEARSLGVPMLLSDIAVHREQAADSAAFFDRHSAVALADALHGFNALDAQARAVRKREAQADAQQRVARFAADFVQLANRCLNETPARVAVAPQ